MRCRLFTFAMDIQVRPRKKRKTRRDCPLLEGDTEAAEAVTVEHVEVNTRRGPVVKAVLVPLDLSGAEIPEGRALPLEEGAHPTDFSPCDMDPVEVPGAPKRNMVRRPLVLLMLFLYLCFTATTLPQGICDPSGCPLECPA